MPVPAITQTTDKTNFYNFGTSQVPGRRLFALVNGYISDRGGVLGLPQPVQNNRQLNQNQQQNAAINPAINQPVQMQVLYPSLNLRARLAVLGAAFGPLMEELATLKAAYEAAVNTFALPQLGGIGAVDPTASDWNWLLTKDGVGNLMFFPGPDGTTFTLPGNPFTFFSGATPPSGVPVNTWFIANITVDQTSGLASVAYTQGGTIPNGVVTGGTPWTGPDPM